MSEDCNKNLDIIDVFNYRLSGELNAESNKARSGRQDKTYEDGFIDGMEAAGAVITGLTEEIRGLKAEIEELKDNANPDTAHHDD